ncbi:alpha/beta fold hydrolase [Nonomuraea mangrovi]|uniref:Alpha/beta fold hydrolase n=1 Tax=Nonomuraea mangrovi TaxID=2316207 RepID=A0ABW4SUK3_9ACTN
MKGKLDVSERGRALADDGCRRALLAGVPVRDRRLRLAGVSTAVLEGGDGPPVLLLHSSGEFAALWTRVIPDLVTTRRVVAPDLPGHGASVVVAGPLDAAQVLAWLGELIERTCPSPPTLVGHGLGGAIAARLAGYQGDRLGRLVLVDSFGLDSFEPAPSFGAALTDFLAEPTEHTRDGLFQQCFVDLDGLREQMGVRWEPLGRYALERARTPSQQTALGRLMPHIGVPAIPSADLARIAVPTMLIWGRQDLQVRLSVAEAASARYGWPLHVIENCGDDPAMEQPEAFMAAMRPALGR